MKFIPGGLGTNLSGAMGATVASHNRGGSYFRRRSKPTISTTSFAEEAKERFSEVSAGWSLLSAASREAWTLWAANNPITDRIGQKITLDGHSAFTKCNVMQTWAGGDAINLPPVDPPPVPLQTMSINGAVVSSALNVYWNWQPSQVSQVLMIKAAVMASSARNFVKGKLKLLAVGDGAGGSQMNILTAIQDRIGTIQNGERLHVAVSVYDPVSGLQSMPVTDADEISGIE